jgi:hypothetical protein
MIHVLKGSPKLTSPRLPLLLALALAQAGLGALTQADAGNRIVAWGDIHYDVLAASQPVTAQGPSVLQIAAGDFHSVALNAMGNVLVWGDNRFGQTALPELLQRTAATQIAAGNVHNLALTRDGMVVGWGPAPGQPGDYG